MLTDTLSRSKLNYLCIHAPIPHNGTFLYSVEIPPPPPPGPRRHAETSAISGRSPPCSACRERPRDGRRPILANVKTWKRLSADYTRALFHEERPPRVIAATGCTRAAR